jgi:hypothetical protein
MILTDAQELAIIHATRPLGEPEQHAFLKALGKLFAGRDDIGDGELGRTLRDLQREYFQPPTDAEIHMREPHHRSPRRLERIDLRAFGPKHCSPCD